MRYTLLTLFVVSFLVAPHRASAVYEIPENWPGTIFTCGGNYGACERFNTAGGGTTWWGLGEPSCKQISRTTSGVPYNGGACGVCGADGSCVFYRGTDPIFENVDDGGDVIVVTPNDEGDAGDADTGTVDSPTSGTGSGPGGSGGGTGEKKLINLASVDSITELLAKVLQLLVQVGTILLVFFLVLTGFKFVAAQGNPGAVEEARSSLMWVVIGGMLLLGAQVFSMVIAAAVTSL